VVRRHGRRRLARRRRGREEQRSGGQALQDRRGPDPRRPDRPVGRRALRAPHNRDGGARRRAALTDGGIRDGAAFAPMPWFPSWTGQGTELASIGGTMDCGRPRTFVRFRIRTHLRTFFWRRERRRARDARLAVGWAPPRLPSRPHAPERPTNPVLLLRKRTRPEIVPM